LTNLLCRSGLQTGPRGPERDPTVPAIVRFIYASVSIPSLRHRAGTAPREQSIRFPCRNLTLRGSQTDPSTNRPTSSQRTIIRSSREGCLITIDHFERQNEQVRVPCICLSSELEYPQNRRLKVSQVCRAAAFGPREGRDAATGGFHRDYRTCITTG
jgi:hypothetical protein